MILALAGGVGGARLANGLQQVVGARLTVAVNTGDDFVHLGLHVAPDLDTVMYTLAGLNNPELGWGRAGESWAFMDALRALGGADWFQLGDRDLATHVERTRRLAAGARLSSVTADFCARLGIAARVLPMSDDPVRTMVATDAGELEFQDYFVRQRCVPVARGFRFAGIDQAQPHPALLAALDDPALDAIVICPSNPFVSVAPILDLPGLRAALARRRAPLVAVSPIVGGAAVKGPAAKMLGELGLECSARGVARHYGALLDGFVIDVQDAALSPEIEALGPRVLATDSIMRDAAGQARLARAVLDFAASLPRR